MYTDPATAFIWSQSTPTTTPSPPADRTRPLRVLFVSPYYKPSWGGIERVVDELGASLRAQGHVVGVLCAPYVFPRQYVPGLAPREVIDGDVQLFRLEPRPRLAPPFFSVPLVWFSPREVARVLETFRPDVIHWVGDGWFLVHFWTWWFGHRRAAIVFTPSFHRLRPAYRWLQPINIMLARLASQVTALSSTEQRSLRRTYWVPPARLQTIGWGVEPARLDPTPPHGWDSAAQTILCVGRLGDHKQQRWLLERVLRVRPRLPPGRRVRLVLVGRDEGGQAALRSEIAGAGADDQVLLTGEVDDGELRRWYTRADIFALFSRYEAFGLAYREAMSYAKPVVTHAVGATREVVGDGGIVVPAFDAGAAEEALLLLLTDDARRHAVGAAAAKIASAHTWPAITTRFVAIYQAARSARIDVP